MKTLTFDERAWRLYDIAGRPVEILARTETVLFGRYFIFDDDAGNGQWFDAMWDAHTGEVENQSLHSDYNLDLSAAPQPEPVETAEQLFEAIKHGDETHRAWLKEAIANFFSGKPIPPPAGQGNKEALVASAVRAENENNAICLETLAGKPQEIRLHAGELSASELRAVQAVLRFAAQSIRARQDGK